MKKKPGDTPSATLRFEGSSACNTYCDTRYLFVMIIDENPEH